MGRVGQDASHVGAIGYGIGGPGVIAQVHDQGRLIAGRKLPADLPAVGIIEFRINNGYIL
jgi:hypothetical protein